MLTTPTLVSPRLNNDQVITQAAGKADQPSSHQLLASRLVGACLDGGWHDST